MEELKYLRQMAEEANDKITPLILPTQYSSSSESEEDSEEDSDEEDGDKKMPATSNTVVSEKITPLHLPTQNSSESDDDSESDEESYDEDDNEDKVASKKPAAQQGKMPKKEHEEDWEGENEFEWDASVEGMKKVRHQIFVTLLCM